MYIIPTMRLFVVHLPNQSEDGIMGVYIHSQSGHILLFQECISLSNHKNDSRMDHISNQSKDRKTS